MGNATNAMSYQRSTLSGERFLVEIRGTDAKKNRHRKERKTGCQSSHSQYEQN